MLTYRINHFVVTGIPKECTQAEAISPLFPQRYGKIEPKRQILRYEQLLKEHEKFIELNFFGVATLITNGQESMPIFIEMVEPKFTIKNQVLYLQAESLDMDEIMLLPRQQVDTRYRVVDAWHLLFHNRPYFVHRELNVANTIAIGESGDRNSLFEMTVGEHACFRDGHIKLANRKWSYTLDLDYLIRATDSQHVAICGNEAYVLDRATVNDGYQINVEKTYGRDKIHIQPKAFKVDPYPAGQPMENFKLPQHVKIQSAKEAIATFGIKI